VSNSGYHIVQQDETVYSIARAYGTTPQKISELNNLKNYQITVGKKLKVK
ncbi:TPA: LysM peptidoglycan-binding domain-containing protein, partial [Mannheimia haemolytica]|nr:LysM peptidoglycan-binding domain-containing protein [Mannheimia haemolytica]HDL4531100.1 LysM peptidoglycan-binding domain-containing protein [Mannheimia haemolytica]